jgi:hypothetical protein
LARISGAFRQADFETCLALESARGPLGIAVKTGKLRRIFVWGSFVTTKPSPKDLDILLIMDEDFEVEQIELAAQAVFNSLRASYCSNLMSFGHAPLSVTKSFNCGWRPIKLQETFENAVLWNWSRCDSNRRSDATRSAMH